MKVSLMLADHAQAVGGKLFISGGGWSVTGPGPVQMAIAMDVKVPWDERDSEHQLVLELLDADGAPVLVPTPMGVEPLRMEGTLTIDTSGIDPAVKPGTPLDAPFAINFAPVPLAPGRRYEWRLTVNDDQDEDWTLPFTTRPVHSEAEAA